MEVKISTQTRIIEVLTADAGAGYSCSELANLLRLSKSCIKRHTSCLVGANLIDQIIVPDEQGRKTKYVRWNPVFDVAKVSTLK